MPAAAGAGSGMGSPANTAACAGAGAARPLLGRVEQADLDTAQQAVPNDACFVVSALAGRAIRLMQEDPSLEALEVPAVCERCLLDALPGIVQRAAGRMPQVTWTSPCRSQRQAPPRQRNPRRRSRVEAARRARRRAMRRSRSPPWSRPAGRTARRAVPASASWQRPAVLRPLHERPLDRFHRTARLQRGAARPGAALHQRRALPSNRWTASPNRACARHLPAKFRMLEGPRPSARSVARTGATPPRHARDRHRLRPRGLGAQPENRVRLALAAAKAASAS